MRCSRRRRRSLRLSALSLLAGFGLLSLAPLLFAADPVDGSGDCSLTRRDPAGSDRTRDTDADQISAARKAPVERVVAGDRRAQPSADRRGPVASGPLVAAAPGSARPLRTHLTDPAYLQVFLSATPQSLRAPPV